MNTLGTIRAALERALPYMRSTACIEYVTDFLVAGDNGGQWSFMDPETALDGSAANLVYWFCHMRLQPYGNEEFDDALEKVRDSLKDIERELSKAP